MIEAQVHGKFKLFTGSLDADGSLASLTREAAAWANDKKVAPKSIGVEYLESTKRVLFTIGYRDDEAAYRVKLTAIPITRIGALDAPEIARVEAAMETASAKLGRIICHELYVTETGDLTMVFMTHEA